MLPDEVRKAVERLSVWLRNPPKVLASMYRGNARASYADEARMLANDVATIRAHLLAREAELTELRREMDDYNAIESALEDAVATSNKHRDRADRAEATLHEIRDSTHKSALMLRAMADRCITAHLSENSREV